MALFGRLSARQRLRNAARESLAIPAFSAPVDCSSWVLGGLWPAELATITPETAPLADYLNADLQRIADSANEKLHVISRSELTGPARQAAETRVINVARAFAVLRVESTVRQLHKEALEFGTEYVSLASPPAAGPAAQAPADPSEAPRTVDAPGQAPETSAPQSRHRLPENGADPAPFTPGLPEPEAPEVPEVAPAWEWPELFQPLIPEGGFEAELIIPAAPVVATAPETPVAEPSDRRLQRLLAFVARQEPGLRWAIGVFADGATRLITDIAHGWVPSGIELPAAVQLLEPGRRIGTVTDMLSGATESVGYRPGDRLGWASDFAATETSVTPRELPLVRDLGWQLSEATHWREGLPRMVNTLAKAGSAGTGVVDAEIDLLRVHLDTLRYQLLAQYPDADTALVLNCMLLAATEAIATGDTVSANYHYSWFRAMVAPPVGQWDLQS